MTQSVQALIISFSFLICTQVIFSHRKPRHGDTYLIGSDLTTAITVILEVNFNENMNSYSERLSTLVL